MRMLPTLRWSLQQRGAAGTVRAVVEGLRRRLRKREKEINAVHPFDLRYQTDTSGVIGGGRLATGSPNDVHITAYVGISPWRFEQSLKMWSASIGALAIPDFTFVDLGSGKGRAVMLASQYPFREVRGVEINPTLSEVARRNLKIWERTGSARTQIVLMTQDVVELTLPRGHCLLYIYNAFSSALTAALLDVIQQQVESSQALYILYQNESEATPLKADPRLECVWTGKLPMPDEEQEADPVSSLDDVTGLYRWVSSR